MKKLFALLCLGIIAAASISLSAQRPGYQRYVITKYVNNGKVTEADGSFGYWVKFDGNIMWIDLGFGGSDARYVYNSQKDGNAFYNFTAYNYGTMSQGSGYIFVNGCWALVSPDRKTINTAMNNGNNVTVLKLQTTDDIGDIIE